MNTLNQTSQLSRSNSRNSILESFTDPGRAFWMQWLAGALTSAAFLYGLTHYKMGSFNELYNLVLGLHFIITPVTYLLANAYEVKGGYLKSAIKIGLGWSGLFIIFAFLAFISKSSSTYSREVMLTWFVLGYLGQLIVYFPLKRLQTKAYEAIKAQRRVLIIGEGANNEELIDYFKQNDSETLVGWVSLREPEQATAAQLNRLGNIDKLEDILSTQSIERVYLFLSAKEQAALKPLYLWLMSKQIDLIWMPDLSGLILVNHHSKMLNGSPAFYLNQSPLTTSPTAAMFKSLFDRTVALLGLIALAPLLILVSLIIKLTSKGPVFFKQTRQGWNGKPFSIYKFRSMYLHEDTTVKQATKDDARITPIGRLLRRTSIDELPQLINVIKGEMALVGPRPHAIAHNQQYSNTISTYMMRHKIKPGLTGWAQVNGSRGETDTLEKMETRIKYDLEYINNWSIWFDIEILLKTPYALFKGDAY
ncbi:undecaprenyl-phosphate glucose phosphotransferase [Marinobacterium sp. xm-d-564]|uniref:undecaprenyl-phosphate glucose phosphotransferase n=1 Tax=Marinobacterium sp. xm-d-564 TaxID=2497742 RepID=UPI001567D322|nr:undecaprenyl-phosphate glucose phosphotransferase [Marinobacterium sp. xm-d-564]NRP59893.1 UDP-glucose:undecaprenyl-phosphate glucose-1-phosphate transferase [Marinobacterium sp. xm-d-564]